MGLPISEASAVALAKASQGFPQHIHGYLNGALEAIDKHGSLDVDGALDCALKLGDEARADYYDTRLAMLADQDAMLALIEAMLKTGRESLRRSKAVAAVAASHSDSANVVDQAIAHGVLTLHRGGVSFGIPSFRRHMEGLLAEYRAHQPQA